MPWMFLGQMRHETVTKAAVAGFDLKAAGYLVSIASVILLGTVAWPKPTDPHWHVPVLIAGMATSILGMAFRYKAHLHQRREMKRTKAEARSS
ncbi:putative membrane protein YqhA [Sphingomonas sp. F9_3S_D5_B_2]